MYKRFALAGVLIVFFTAAAVASAVLLQVDAVVQELQNHGHVARLAPGTVTAPPSGKPQTLLLVGSDRRFGERRGDARSDTLMLVRLDPHQQATAVLSIPRDLLVTIPGHGQDKVNAAYSAGGLDLTVRTVKDLLGLKVHHAIEVNFQGFRRAVDFLKCVYVDVDRRYFHSNAGVPIGQRYAAIDIQPGYQRLCGRQSLDYVRFRHLDNDVVRAARQQQFLTAAKEQAGGSSLLSKFPPLVRIFAKATETDADLQSSRGILRLLKLAAFSTGHPVREVPFPAHFVNVPAPRSRGTTTAGAAAAGPATAPPGVVTGIGDYVTAGPDEIARTVDAFLHPKGVVGATHHAKRKVARRARGPRRPPTLAESGLVDARARGQRLVSDVVRRQALDFPLYVPGALTPRGAYPTTARNARIPRVYTLLDRAGRPHRAYRIVVAEDPANGQYYGVQGTSWRTPPILGRGGDVQHLGRRTFRMVYDGSHLRVVAWRTDRALYWVSNTLSLALTNKQMLGIARSLTRGRG
jgi:LCP family protein required for cell wall assembly